MSIILNIHTVFYLYTYISLMVHHFTNFSARNYTKSAIGSQVPTLHRVGKLHHLRWRIQLSLGSVFFGIHIEVVVFSYSSPQKNTWNWIYWNLIWRYNFWIRRNWNWSWWECFFWDFPCWLDQFSKRYIHHLQAPDWVKNWGPFTRGYNTMELWFEMCQEVYNISKADVLENVRRTNAFYGGTKFLDRDLVNMLRE